MGNKILFFGGFGPLEEPDTNSQEEGAEFGWFNDLFCFDTGIHHVQLGHIIPTTLGDKRYSLKGCFSNSLTRKQLQISPTNVYIYQYVCLKSFN